MHAPVLELHLYARLQELELDLIHRALCGAKGNRTQAAALLSLNRSTLVMKIKKLGLMHVDYTRRCQTCDTTSPKYPFTLENK